MLQSRIKVGEFDTKITIEQYTATRDSVTNEEIKTWSTYAEVLSKKTHGSFGESSEGNQVVSSNTDEFLIRYSSSTSDVNAKMRIKEGCDCYYITGVQKEKRQGWIKIVGELRDV